eukprot:CAMPEP_0183353680 /NCGR_PEP_ID=MMETSP0164_2-20130417/34525_1 /TAXON_ID=221442 /ORGANISM="Coccolithus pelagicus ssp braarudi, Strain PLY182g" /LENGTH=183 /DNA_ID=CAMNT_0025526403 /DNA_START=445 /DNA_END=993 /DNA_ORIENTATION=-
MTQEPCCNAGDAGEMRSRSLDLVEFLHSVEDGLLGCLLHLASEEELVEDHVHLVEVEDQVKLAYVAKELVEKLDEEVDGLEVHKFIVHHIHADGEEEARVTPVYELVLLELDEVGELWVARGDNAVDLSLDLHLFIIRVRTVILRETRLSLPVLQQQELDHRPVKSPTSTLQAVARSACVACL